MSDSLYAVAEFPPEHKGEKPQTAIILKTWLLPDNECWWPCHLKNDVAIQRALISKEEPGAGYMTCPFLRVLHEYDTYKDARKGLTKSELTSDLESNNEQTLKSSRGRHIKRKFQLYEDNEDDCQPKKTSVKAPPVISFPSSESESSMGEACSKTKSQAYSVEKKRESVEKTSKKISNSRKENIQPLKKDKLCKNISTVVKKQGIGAELASASRLKKRLSLQEYDTSMKLNKSPKHIFTEMSRKSVKVPPSPSKQSTSCREAREKSPVIAPLTHRKARTYSIIPLVPSKQRILDQNSTAHTASSLKQSTSCHEAREKSPLDQNSRVHTASPSLLEQKTHMSASQSPVSSQSVSDLNVDVSSPSLTHSNIADSSMSEFDIKDNNVGNSQRNNHGDKCAHGSSSDNNYTDSDHDNQVVAPKKATGMDMVKNLVYMVKAMKETQHNHGILLEEVVQRLRNKGITLSHPEGMPQIPLENINEAERMEECLASSTARIEYLTKRLSTEGGTSVEGCVDRIMRKLLTRAVGSLYSYKGRRQKGNDPKLAFSPTNMCKAVKDAVLLVHPDANGRIVEKSIMDYLRYSPFRSQK